MGKEQSSGEVREAEEAPLPKVHIQIGADNNTLLVNDKKICLSKGTRMGDSRVTKQSVDAIFILNYLQQNQGRLITSSELIDAFMGNLLDDEEKVLHLHPDEIQLKSSRKATSIRIRNASRTLSSLVVDRIPIIKQGNIGSNSVIGVMGFNLTTERVLINLKDYPYPFNQRLTPP